MNFHAAMTNVRMRIQSEEIEAAIVAHLERGIPLSSLSLEREGWETRLLVNGQPSWFGRWSFSGVNDGRWESGDLS